MNILIHLKTDLFTTDIDRAIKDFLEGTSIGTDLYIDLDTSTRCPFTQREMEDQFRTVYGGTIYFGTVYDATKSIHLNARKPSQDLLRRFFAGEQLVNGEVPPEVYHFLEVYREKHLPLINYLSR